MGNITTKSLEGGMMDMDVSSAHSKREIMGSDGEGLYADQCLKFCTKCRNCYEIIMTRGKRKGRYIHMYHVALYKDFPSYGKEKKTCPRCLGQELTRIIE